MSEKPELIVMLTQDDRTVKNACEVFEQCKNTKAKFWGFKEEGLTFAQMKELSAYMKSCDKTTVLEVVAYTEKECIAGAQAAADCNFDILMGTVFFDSVSDICKENGIKYMPFVGKVTQRPSVLEGNIEDIIRQAESYYDKGVYGFDLLGYRYTGDSKELNNKFISDIRLPVCVAGSVDSYQKLDEIKSTSAWAFTIGSAFFENKFDGTFAEQINKVCDYMNT
ncbi:MAG: hypothetical protein J6L89_08345 [Clostridia bacterium]|nr:hypothetical protein [Clostridia bacterium]